MSWSGWRYLGTYGLCFFVFLPRSWTISRYLLRRWGLSLGLGRVVQGQHPSNNLVVTPQKTSTEFVKRIIFLSLRFFLNALEDFITIYCIGLLWTWVPLGVDFLCQDLWVSILILSVWRTKVKPAEGRKNPKFCKIGRIDEFFILFLLTPNWVMLKGYTYNFSSQC